MRRAERLQASDPARANALWAEVDRAIVDRAAAVPLFNARVLTFVSERVGNHQFHLQWGMLLDQMWVQYRDEVAGKARAGPRGGPSREGHRSQALVSDRRLTSSLERRTADVLLQEAAHPVGDELELLLQRKVSRVQEVYLGVG